jgi:NADH dehydrogenase [ubiquinone] 1 alpha subcomplex assembly factor 7
MRLALTHPQHGYYTQQEVFGPQGDFVTSPEISQVFGELIGSWYAQQFNEYHQCRYVELGPGTGSLLADMLSVWKQLRDKTNQKSSLVGIHLVEQSHRLRELQREKIERVLGHRLESIDSASARSKDWFTVHWHDDFLEVPVGKYSFA